MLVFCANEISVADITALIDKGYRFSVTLQEDKVEETTRVEDYLDGKVDIPDICGV